MAGQVEQTWSCADLCPSQAFGPFNISFFDVTHRQITLSTGTLMVSPMLTDRVSMFMFALCRKEKKEDVCFLR